MDTTTTKAPVLKQQVVQHAREVAERTALATFVDDAVEGYENTLALKAARHAQRKLPRLELQALREGKGDKRKSTFVDFERLPSQGRATLQAPLPESFTSSITRW